MGHSCSQPIPELPPEVVLNILLFLPGLRFDGLRFLSGRTSLVEMALVSKAWAELSQQVLFRRVELFTQEGIERWGLTEASKWTRFLLIRLHNLDDQEDRFEWLEGLLSTLCSSKADKGGLEVLQLDLLWSDTKLKADLLSIAGLQDIHSLKFRGSRFPSVLPSASLTTLRHLRVIHFDHTPAGELPFLPSLTHLTCESAFGSHLPHLATAFPNLIYLFSASLWSAHQADSVLASLPPLLTHFGTDQPLNHDVCADLPDRLVELTLRGHHPNLAALHSRWLISPGQQPVFTLRLFYSKADPEPPADRAFMAELRAFLVAGGDLKIMKENEWEEAGWRGLERSPVGGAHLPKDWPKRYQSGLSYHWTRLGLWIFGERAFEEMEP